MPITKAKLEGNARHQEKLRRIVIQPYKDEAERIMECAKNHNQSVTEYILQAVRARMEWESK